MARKSITKRRSEEQLLVDEVRTLRVLLHDAKKDYDQKRRPLRLLSYSFGKGLAYGLGAIAAVAIVTPLIALLLQRVEWPPIVAGFVSQVILQIERVSPR